MSVVASKGIALTLLRKEAFYPRISYSSRYSINSYPSYPERYVDKNDFHGCQVDERWTKREEKVEVFKCGVISG